MTHDLRSNDAILNDFDDFLSDINEESHIYFAYNVEYFEHSLINMLLNMLNRYIFITAATITTAEPYNNCIQCDWFSFSTSDSQR